MLFKNKGKKPVKVRKGTPFNYYWISIREGETIDLPRDVGLNKGLIEEKRVLKPKINSKQAETKVFKGSEESYTPKSTYVQELKKIKGIGPKTAEDIVKWGTKEKLREYIKKNKHLPFHDNIVTKLKKNMRGQHGK